METTNNNYFEISLALEKDLDIHKFLVGKELESILNENTNFQDIRSKLSGVLIVFQCFKKDNVYFQAKEYQLFRRKTKILELYTLIDFESVVMATENEMRKIFWNSFVNLIPAIEKHTKNSLFTPEQLSEIEKQFLNL